MLFRKAEMTPQISQSKLVSQWHMWMSGGTKNMNPFMNSHSGTENINSLKWHINFSIINNFLNETIFPSPRESQEMLAFSDQTKFYSRKVSEHALKFSQMQRASKAVRTIQGNYLDWEEYLWMITLLHSEQRLGCVYPANPGSDGAQNAHAHIHKTERFNFIPRKPVAFFKPLVLSNRQQKPHFSAGLILIFLKKNWKNVWNLDSWKKTSYWSPLIFRGFVQQ